MNTTTSESLTSFSPFSSTGTSSSSTSSLLGSSSSYTSTTSGSWMDSFKNISGVTWLLVILILALLGFNIFSYLAQGTQTVTDIFGPLVKKILGTTVAVTGQAVDVTAEGAKAVVGGTADVIESGLTEIQDITPKGALKGQPVETNTPQGDQSSLNKALQSNTQTQTQNQNRDYEASEAVSTVHSAGKAGWCYVGQDRGFRSCAQVGVNDTCMSGDIFPSQEICMNPNLRA